MTPKAGSFILMLAVQSKYSEAILASSHIAPVFLVGIKQPDAPVARLAENRYL